MATATRTFADDVRAACDAVPAAGRVGSKVWIHAAWAIGGFDASLDEFKAMLAEASRAGVLVLGRCDQVEAFDRHDVKRSTLSRDGATFNFIRL